MNKYMLVQSEDCTKASTVLHAKYAVFIHL